MLPLLSWMPAPTPHGLPVEARVLTLVATQPAGRAVPLKPSLNDAAWTEVPRLDSARPSAMEAVIALNFMLNPRDVWEEGCCVVDKQHRATCVYRVPASCKAVNAVPPQPRVSLPPRDEGGEPGFASIPHTRGGTHRGQPLGCGRSGGPGKGRHNTPRAGGQG